MVYRSKHSVAFAVAVLIALSSLHSVASLATRSPTPPVQGMKRILNAFSSPHRQHEADVLLSSSTQIDDGQSEKSSRLRTSPVASFFLIFYARALDLFEKQPFLTNSIVTGVLAGFGDVLAQQFTGNTNVAGVAPAFNWIRWRTFLLTGLLFEGPWLCVWYNGLSKFARWLETRYQWGPRQQVLAKVAFDQTIGVAIFYPAFFASYEIFGAVLTGRVPNLYKALMACRADLAAVWVAQYKVWPAVDWFNFTYVPEPLRVLFIGFITLFWNCYLATMLAHGAHS